jgi:hypothetical protein
MCIRVRKLIPAARARVRWRAVPLFEKEPWGTQGSFRSKRRLLGIAA